MPVAKAVADRAKVMWRMKLHSALRTALACTIVGCITLYGPPCFRATVPFPAFSYVTAILVVSDANLGDAIRGCCHALYATLQVLPLSMLSIRFIPYDSFSPGIAAVMVALTSFLVGLPESTPLLAKRIAFGQIVIMHVYVFIHGGNHSKSNGVMLPLQVASSTALGAVSSLLALLLPYPRLAHSEVRRLCQLYAENASERLNLYFKALSAESHWMTLELIYQAKPLAATGNKLLQSITLMQDGVLWERPWTIFSKPDYQSPGERLLGFETPVRGMEIALSFCHLHARLANQELTRILLGALSIFGVKGDQATCFSPFNFNPTKVPELTREFVEKLIFPNETILSEDKEQWACFFMSFAQQFVNDFGTRENTDDTVLGSNMQKDSQESPFISIKEFCGNWIMKLNKERLLFASKCSLSLGLAVLSGLIFNRENGYWSGLTIAISFVEGRQAIFSAANARAQGTAIGSVYGVLGCFIFEDLVNIRFLALIPWIIFTSFLRHSQMYGQAGGISAVIGALLILGRNNYGPHPDQFAIARLTEAVIGLCSFILIELLLQPTRASTLAKKHLYLTLGTLQECIKQIVLSAEGNDGSSMRFQAFRKEQRNLKSHIHNLRSSTAEAELEPNFWFLPFRGSSYQKLLDSLSNMAVLLSCMTYSLEFLLQASQNYSAHWKELQEHINNDLELYKEILTSSLRFLENSTFPRSFQVFKQPQQKKVYNDLEKGNLPAQNVFAASDVENYNSIATSLPQLLKNVADNVRDAEGGEELKAKMIFSLSALGFCIGCMGTEIKDTERSIKELMYWENP